MVYKIFLTSMILCWCTVGFAQLVVEQPSFDFGTIKDDKVQEHVFTIRNQGNTTVRLTATPASCGCMASKPYPDILPPGKEAKFYVAFEPKGRRGTFRWEAALETSLPDQPKIVFPMKAYILRNDIISDYLVNFRVFKRKERKKITLWLACPQHPDFKLKKVYASIPGFTIQTTDSEKIIVTRSDLLWPNIGLRFSKGKIGGFYPGPQRGYRIDISPRKDIGYGRNHGKVIVVTDIPGHEQLKLRLYAYVIGEITAAPDYLSFGLVKPGKTYKRKVVLSHNEYKKFNIKGVSSTLNFATATIETIIPEKYYYLWVTLECPPNAKTGEFRGKISLKTDCPAHDTVQVNLQGFIKNENVTDLKKGGKR